MLFSRLIREISLEPINRQLGGTTVLLYLDMKRNLAENKIITFLDISRTLSGKFYGKNFCPKNLMHS